MGTAETVSCKCFKCHKQFEVTGGEGRTVVCPCCCTERKIEEVSKFSVDRSFVRKKKADSEARLQMEELKASRINDPLMMEWM